MIIIINGEVKADQSLRELSMSHDATLVLEQDNEEVAGTLASLEGISRVQPFRSSDDFPAYRIIGSADITPGVYTMARDRNWRLRELRRDTITLEAFFNQLATTA